MEILVRGVSRRRGDISKEIYQRRENSEEGNTDGWV
jgi:hypothetical protein